MRRFLVVAGACALLAGSSVPALAKPPSRGDIKSFGTAAVTDPCMTASTGSSLGRLQINKRGKSGGGGQYKVQVKLTGGSGVEASNTYDVLLYTVGSDTSSPTPIATCTSTDVGDLKTNGGGKGTMNFKYNAAAPSSQVVVVLRDKTIPSGGTASPDLGSGLVTLTNP